MVSEARKNYLASMTPSQAAANQATAGYTPASQMNTVTLTPQHEAQVQQAYSQGTTSVPQYALPNATGPIGQAVAGIEATRGAQGQQGYYAPAIPQPTISQPQQSQPMQGQAQRTGWDLAINGPIPTPQEMAQAQANLQTRNLLGNMPNAQDLMMALPIPKGLGQVGTEINAVRAGSRATFTNPRLMAKLTPEALEAIKKITTQTEGYQVAGAKLLTEAGRKEFASTAASKTSEIIGEIGSNSKTLGLKLGAAVKVLSKAVTLQKLIGIGIIGSLLKGGTQAQDEAVAFQSGIVKSIKEMRETGDPQQIANADELAAMNTDLLDDFTTIWHTPYIWNANERKKINDFKIKADQIKADNEAWKRSEVMNTMKNQLDREAKKSEADRKVLASMVGKTDEEIVNSSEIAEAANDNALIQRRYMEALQNIKNKRDEEEQRLYNEMQKELDRRYAEGQKAAQQAFTQSLPEDSGGSALNFGGGQW